ncbi:MAG: hypothetical protein HYU58_11895 [Proteobacteria bacterium]|nr:hypothetical protein [Pseudomonadota bacterium]
MALSSQLNPWAPKVLSIVRIVAGLVFLVHAPQSFFPAVNQGDAAILYCFLFFYFFFAGPGPWSVDAKMGRE